MNLKKIKLVALDLDGTLVIDRYPISEYACKYITLLKEGGMVMTLLTGKHKNDLGDYMIVSCKDIPYVTSNGTQVWLNGQELLWEKTIDYRYISIFCEIAIKIGAKVRLYGCNKTYDWNEIPSDLSECRWLRMVIKSDLENIVEMIYQKIACYKKYCSIDRQKPTRIDIHALNTGKKEGIEFVAKYLDLSSEQIMVIGDNINDIEAIKWAGIGVAMANADSNVKIQADVVTKKDVYEDGAISYLLELARNNGFAGFLNSKKAIINN